MNKKNKIAASALIILSVFFSGCSTVILEQNGTGHGFIYSDKELAFSGISFQETIVKPVPEIPNKNYTVTITSQTELPKPQTTITVPETTTVTEKVEPDKIDVTTTTTASAVITTRENIILSSTTKPQTITPKPVEIPSMDNLPQNSYSALNYEETKGIWISYFELYPVLTNKSKDRLAAGIGEYYDKIKALGLNTVYVHVRPYGDAIYKSSLYPWSKYCTGYIAEDPGYDPLPVMIDEAHKRGISFQAWINPLRCYINDDISRIPDSYITKQWYNDYSGKKIVRVDNYWYLNPAYNDVINLIASGVSEIVSKYNVDGVHIDDYFYPTTDEWFDKEAFNASSYNDLQQFRLDNCTSMVSSMYNAVKSHNPTAIFGVSTQGNIANNYAYMYADVEKWCTQKGYVDYMAPQIYYGFENAAQPYASVVEQWDKMLKGTGKKLIPGLSVYKIGKEDTWAGSGKYEWINNTQILKRQIQKAKTASTYGGVVLYSYQFVFEPESDVSYAVNAEINAVKSEIS